ncbi:MAG: creatininase family protein [Longimicrobiales bacterium]|nr:creatininase family protein [Longimicrobiales bacterium]
MNPAARSRSASLFVVILALAPGLVPSLGPSPGSALHAQTPDASRPIDALDSVWIEELTWMEVRDAIAGGMTTALVLTGGVEANGPYLATGKHNYSNRVMGEAVARELGDALVAPIVTLEPGRPDRDPRIGTTGPVVSQETYIAWLTDIGDSLRGMGFTEVYYLGDSGGNQRGQAAAADALNAKYGGEPTTFHHLPDFYNHVQVRRHLQEDLGIPEELEFEASRGSDGIHDELSITSILALHDPEVIRHRQRVEAGRASINGIDISDLTWTREIGRKVVSFRTRLTVDAIRALRAAR